MKNLILGSMLATTTLAAAANDPAITQTETMRQQRETKNVLREIGSGDTVPSLYSEEDLDVGPQAVLRRREHQWFRGSADAQVYYTDNMFFRRNGDVDAGVAITTAEAALTMPPCITPWASYRAEAGYRHQFFNYFGDNDPIAPGVRSRKPLERSDFDFESSTLFADVLAQTKHYQFRAGFDYTRLLGFEPLRRNDYEDFYTEYVPRWSVQRNFRVCDGSQFSVAYLGSYNFTEEDAVLFSTAPGRFRRGLQDRSERWEHSAIAAYTVALPWNWVAQPYYRFQFTEFTNLDDRENLHTAGLSLGWYPCANFSARLFGNYNWNDSDNLLHRYEQLNVGGGLEVMLRF